MHTLAAKLKAATSAWLASLLIGGTLITAGAGQDSSTIIALITFIGLYITTYSFWLRDDSRDEISYDVFPVTAKEVNNKIAPPLDLVYFKKAALELQLSNASLVGKYSLKKLDRAFEQAVLSTIENDSNEIFKEQQFATYFTQYVNSFERVNRLSNLTIDEVIIDIQNRPIKTKLQSDFSTYVCNLTTNLPVHARSELRLFYIHDPLENRLVVRDMFRNRWGSNIVEFIGILNARKKSLGMTDVLKISTDLKLAKRTAHDNHL